MVNKEPALISDGFYDVMWANNNNNAFDSNQLYAFIRYNNTQCLLVIASFSADEKSYRLIIPEDAFSHVGMSVENFFTGTDLLDLNDNIQFPGEVALSAGIGGKIKGYSAAVYNLMWNNSR